VRLQILTGSILNDGIMKNIQGLVTDIVGNCSLYPFP
jgi:hypothetical protein